MITFRYHVVTLVAVFMAIGVGVLFGATFISQNIVDGLEASQARLGDRNEALRGRVLEMEGENSALQLFAASSRDHLVSGILEAVPVLLVGFETTPEAVLNSVRSSLDSAGAQTVGYITISERLTLIDPADRTVVAELLEAGATGPTELAGTLVARMIPALTGADPVLLAQLLEAELVDAPDGPPAPIAAGPGVPGPAVVVLPGTMPRVFEERIVLPLIRGLLIVENVVAAAGGGTDPPVVGSLRGESELPLVTVDSVETPIGSAALVIGLRGGLAGTTGHYGWGEGATTALPSPGALDPEQQ